VEHSAAERHVGVVNICFQETVEDPSLQSLFPAVETATTVMVVGHISRPYVEPVHCRRPRFPDCRCMSREHSVAGRSFIQLFVNFQASAQDRALLT